MQIDLETAEGVTVMKVAGRMDATTTGEFDDVWKKLLSEGTSRIAVELSGLEYISSAGLRSVLLLAKTARAKQADIAFAGMQSMVADMFRISGFQAILATYGTLSEALAKLNS